VEGGSESAYEDGPLHTTDASASLVNCVQDLLNVANWIALAGVFGTAIALPVVISLCVGLSLPLSRSRSLVRLLARFEKVPQRP
jgi:hypothetical protein